jgi:hypothetical protein
MTPVGPFRRRDAVAKAVRDTVWDWHREYLAQLERDEGLPARTLRPFQFVSVRHSNWLTPVEISRGVVAVVWIKGARNHRTDADESIVIADLEVGIRIAVQATKDASSDFLHRYQSAVSQLLYDFPNAEGLCNDLVPLDEDYEPFEVESEAVRMGVDLTFLAVGVEVGERRNGPPPGSMPRPDPYVEPWPDTPTVEETSVDVRPQPVDPEDLP